MVTILKKFKYQVEKKYFFFFFTHVESVRINELKFDHYTGLKMERACLK